MSPATGDSLKPRIVPPLNAPNTQQMRDAKRRADVARKEMVLNIYRGVITILDLLEFLCGDFVDPEVVPALLKIRLRELILHQPKFNEAKTNAVMTKLRAVLRLHATPIPGQRLQVISNDKMTVGWLLDNRTDGHRYRALVDVIRESWSTTSTRRPPDPFWPYTFDEEEGAA